MTEEHSIILAEYTRYLEMKNYKPRGIEGKIHAVKTFMEYLETERLTLAGCTLAEGEAYRSFLHLTQLAGKVTSYTSATINGRLSNIRHFYQFLQATSRVLNNPFIYVERLREEKRIPTAILTVEQIGTLLTALPVKDAKSFTLHVVFSLLYATGMRINEVECLQPGDLFLDRGYLLIRDDKERQTRKAVLPEYTEKILLLYMKYLYNPENPYLFRYSKHRTFYRWVFDNLKKICKDNKLPPIGCHGFRHSIATHLLKNGADLREVQEFLGHQKIKNTEIYVRLALEDLQHVVNTCHPREQEET